MFRRGPSSVSNMNGGPVRWGRGTGAISALNRPSSMRGNRAPVAAQGQLVLVLAADAVGLRGPLGELAHVLVVIRVQQAVVDDGVDQLAVAQPVAEAGVGQQVGREVHVFHAAGDEEVALARPISPRRRT